MDKRIENVEKTLKQVEAEKDFLKAADLFVGIVPTIKQLLAEGKEKHGRVLEVARECDEYIEKEITLVYGS